MMIMMVKVKFMIMMMMEVLIMIMKNYQTTNTMTFETKFINLRD